MCVYSTINRVCVCVISFGSTPRWLSSELNKGLLAVHAESLNDCKKLDDEEVLARASAVHSLLSLEEASVCTYLGTYIVSIVCTYLSTSTLERRSKVVKYDMPTSLMILFLTTAAISIVRDNLLLMDNPWIYS